MSLTRLAAAALALVTAVHLGLQLSGTGGPAEDLTQGLLMPLLALTLWLAVRPARGRLVTGTLVALGFSFLGDVAPDLVPQDLSFLVMVGFFLVAQVVYVATFWPRRGRSVAARRPWLVVPYAVALVALLLACGGGAGPLLLPVVVYGMTITAMAVLATGVSRTAGVGGAVFMLSDALIALDAFAGLALPAQGFWVMLTYVLGQALIVVGVASESGARPLAGQPRGRPRIQYAQK